MKDRFSQIKDIANSIIEIEINENVGYETNFENKIKIETLKQNIIHNYLLYDLKKAIKNLTSIIIVFIISYFLFR